MIKTRIYDKWSPRTLINSVRNEKTTIFYRIIIQSGPFYKVKILFFFYTNGLKDEGQSKINGYSFWITTDQNEHQNSKSTPQQSCCFTINFEQRSSWWNFLAAFLVMWDLPFTSSSLENCCPLNYFLYGCKQMKIWEHQSRFQLLGSNHPLLFHGIY